MLTVRRLRSEEWRDYRALRLRALADAPDAFGSTLEQEQGKPDEFWEQRVGDAAASASDLPLVASAGGHLVGLVWGHIHASDPGTANVYQMWVAPEYRGRGCGGMLLQGVIEWARNAAATTLDLRVTCGNTAAYRLYVRAGFKPAGEPAPVRPGVTLLAQPMRLVF